MFGHYLANKVFLCLAKLANMFKFQALAQDRETSLCIAHNGVSSMSKLKTNEGPVK